MLPIRELHAFNFPEPPKSPDGAPPATISNYNYLLRSYEISVRYDVIKKKIRIAVPTQRGSPDNADSVALTNIISLANLHRLPTKYVKDMVEAVADRNQFNPVADWIESKPWDGTDRFNAFADTLVHRSDFPDDLKRTLLKRWLISAVAAALLPSGFHSRGVLTLQGPQSRGKTRWTKALVSDYALSQEVIKLDHHLDGNSKDSVLTAVTHWIVEIGELDSSFRKDVARLKGFLTADRDTLRRPYGVADSNYSRRTVFVATVNEANFLVDATGNTRWWTIPIERAIYNHGIDMQQLFAQIALDFNAGEPWWLTSEEEARLEEINKEHRHVNATRERLLDRIDVDDTQSGSAKPRTAIEVLKAIGVEQPSNQQCKDCAAVLREFYGESKRIQGRETWRVRFKPTETDLSQRDEDIPF